MSVITLVRVGIRGTLQEIAHLNKVPFWGLGFRVWVEVLGFRVYLFKRASCRVKEGHL